jgi:hypothetical protein
MKMSAKFKVSCQTRNYQPSTRYHQLKVLRLAAFQLVLIGVLLASCHSGNQPKAAAVGSSESGVSKFVFSEEIHNFGSLNAGEIVSYTFSFRNEGTKTLIISEVDSGCGCTQVVIPSKTISPGSEGQLEVIYNSAGEVGRQLKVISILSNATPAKKQLIIQADVTNEVIELDS